MSIAEKLTTIAENEQKVYDAGREAERDRLYEISYSSMTYVSMFLYAFAGYAWTDETYNPTKAIVMNSLTNAGFMFYYSQITDTKVDINLGASAPAQSSSIFAHSKIKTIRKLIIPEGNYIDFTNQFTNAKKLENITIEGVIKKNFNIQWSPLSVVSMKNIIEHLKNHKGTAEENTYTLSFSDDCWARLNADSAPPQEDTWQLYVQNVLGINT